MDSTEACCSEECVSATEPGSSAGPIKRVAGLVELETMDGAIGGVRGTGEDN